MEILKLFNYDLSENQILEIKNLLVKYFAQQTTQKMDEFYDNQGWDEQKIDEIKKEHLRTKYI
jgi:hypothetical protein